MDWAPIVAAAAEEGGMDLRHPLVVALAVVAFTAFATFFSTWFTRREARKEAQEDYDRRTRREDQLRAEDRRHEDARRAHDQRIDSYSLVIEASYGLMRTARRLLPHLRSGDEPVESARREALEGLIEAHVTQFETFSYRWATAKLLASKEVRRGLDLMEAGVAKMTLTINIPFDEEAFELGISTMGQGIKELEPAVQRELGIRSEEESPEPDATPT